MSCEELLQLAESEVGEVPEVPLSFATVSKSAEVPEIRMSSAPKYMKCTEFGNYKAVVQALEIAAVQQTPLFDQLASVADSIYDIEATTGVGKRSFLLWEGPAPPGYKGDLHSGTLPKEEPAAKKVRKEIGLYDGFGFAFLHPAVRAIVRSGSLHSTIRIKNGRFCLLKLVIEKMLSLRMHARV